MNIETIKSECEVTSALFHDQLKELIDVDSIFRLTNKNFGILLMELNLPITFDFSNRTNQRLYMHEFLKTICEFIKNRNSPYTPYFYSNSLTKDKFRNGLIKKIQKIFGFLVWMDCVSLSDFIDRIQSNDCTTFTFEVFFSSFKSPKKFKHIKKYLHQTGLTFMNDVYLEDLSNKILIYR